MQMQVALTVTVAIPVHVYKYISQQMWMSVYWIPVYVSLGRVSTLRGVMNVFVPMATYGMKHPAMVNCYLHGSHSRFTYHS